MKHKSTLWMLLSMVLFTSQLQATCGAYTCPILNFTPIPEKKFEFGVAYESIHQDQVYVGSERSTVGAIPQHHDEKETNTQLYIFSAKYRLSDTSRIRAELPYINRSHEHIHNHHGEKILDSWNMTGAGDASLFYDKVLHHTEVSKLALTTGVKLPTGKREIKNEDGDTAEVPIQPGTGSVDYSLGLFYHQGLFTVPNLDGDQVLLPLKIGVGYTMNGIGTDGWQFGNQFLGSLGTSYLVSKKVSLHLDTIFRTQEKANAGTTGEHTESTGGQWVYLTPGVEVALNDWFSIKTAMQFPLWQDVNGIQLVSPYNIRIDTAIRF